MPLYTLKVRVKSDLPILSVHCRADRALKHEFYDGTHKTEIAGVDSTSPVRSLLSVALEVLLYIVGVVAWYLIFRHLQ